MRRFVFVSALFVAVAPLSAQRVRGNAVNSDSVTPAIGVIVALRDRGGRVVAKTLTGEGGKFELPAPRAGRYSLRILRIGYRPTDSDPFDVADGVPASIRVLLDDRRVTLAPVRIRGESVCGVRADSGQLVASLWEQMRTALAGTQVTGGGSPLRATVLEYQRTLDSSGTTVLSDSWQTKRGSTERPFASLSADTFARTGYVKTDSSGTEFHAPDAEVLLSEAFAAQHCFHVEPAPVGHPEWIGVGVQPAHTRPNIVDIAGVLWLDRASAELRTFEYQYVGLEPALAGLGAGGMVSFRRLQTGHWVINRWSIRMPMARVERAISGFGALATVRSHVVRAGVTIRGGEVITVYRGGELLLNSHAASLRALLVPQDSSLRVGGAKVRVVSTPYVTTADSLGRVRMDTLVPGLYHLSVNVPILDRLGAAPVQTDVDTRRDDGESVARIVLPSLHEILRTECGDSASSNGSSLLFGVAPDSSTVRNRHAAVQITWLGDIGWDSSRRALTQPTLSRTGGLDARGRWRVCGAPRVRSLAIQARVDGVLSPRIVLHIPESLEVAEFVVPDSLFRSAVRGTPGSGSAGTLLSGRIVDAANGGPVERAEVEILGNAARRRTDPEGRYAFRDLPPGEYSVRVRLLGYAPATRLIVIKGDPVVDQDVQLHRLASELAEVRIEGRLLRVPARYEDVYRRATKGFGKLITREDIDSLKPFDTKALLNNFPGVLVNDRGVTFQRCQGGLQGPTGSTQPAKVQVYVDGVRMTGRASDADDVLRLVHPRDIQAVEVFSGVAQIPAEFLDDACAVIAIWTKAY
jgi:hypothetical protein